MLLFPAFGRAMLEFVQRAMKFCDEPPWTSEWVSESINLPSCCVEADCSLGKDDVTNQVDVGSGRCELTNS